MTLERISRKFRNRDRYLVVRPVRRDEGWRATDFDVLGRFKAKGEATEAVERCEGDGVYGAFVLPCFRGMDLLDLEPSEVARMYRSLFGVA